MRSRSLLLMFGTVGALLSAGYGALFGLLDDFRDDYGISEGWLGAVIGVGFFAGFLAQITIAPLADRGHARKLVLIGVVANAAGLLVVAVSEDVVPLLIGRFVMGVGVGMAVPAIRRIVIMADPDRLGHNLGRLLAADVTGFAAGPAVSALLVGPFGIAAPFLVIAVATLALLPFIMRTAVDETAAPTGQRFAFDLLRGRVFTGAVLLGCAVWLMIGTFDALWSLSLDDLDAADWLASLGITMFAVPLMLFGSVGGRLAQRVGPFRVATVGLVLGALFMYLYGMVPTAGAMFVVAMLHSVSDGLTVSSAGVAVGLVVPPERQAGAQGVLGGIQVLVAGITAVMSGLLYEHFGRRAAYATGATAMVVAIAAGLWLARSAWGLRGDPAAANGDSPFTSIEAIDADAESIIVTGAAPHPPA